MEGCHSSFGKAIGPAHAGPAGSTPRHSPRIPKQIARRHYSDELAASSGSPTPSYRVSRETCGVVSSAPPPTQDRRLQLGGDDSSARNTVLDPIFERVKNVTLS